MTTKPRELLHRLFEYIGEQLKDIDPRGFQLSKGFRCSPQDVAGLPGVELDLKLQGDHVWLRIARLEDGKPPKLSQSQEGVILVMTNPSGPLPSLDEGGLQRRVSNATAEMGEVERQKAAANIRASAERDLKEYLEVWKAWAEGEKPRRRAISLYGDLFALKLQMEAEETAKPAELVWGIGIATWRMEFEGTPFPYSYPILTQAVEIYLDDKTMALEVRPRATDTRIEMDAFVACKVTGAADVENAGRDQIARNKDHPVTPFDSGSYTDVLKLVASNLDSKGTYREILSIRAPIPDAGENLVVTDAWALFSRPRTNNYLVEDLKRLQDKLSDGCDIPAGPMALVMPPSDEPIEFEAVNLRGISSRGDGSSGVKPQELYFPLPYNGEQVTIIQRLEHASGVSVQGPPGTGKTHTIANTICHYLATGRRVLVTSKGEPALDVLQSQIPEEVRPLTVALLTSDREGIRQFQASIEAIQHRVSQLNPLQTREEIASLEGAIDRAHSELNVIDRRVDEIALAQFSEVEIDGAPMRAQKLAELVVSGRDQHGWFDDLLSLAPEHAPPLTGDEAGYLCECRRKLGADLVYVDAQIACADALPGPAEISELHAVLVQMRTIDSQVASGDLMPLKGLSTDIIEAARKLLESVEEALALVMEVEDVDGGWPLDLRVKCRLPSFNSERGALEALFSDLEQLVWARAEFLRRPVEIPESALAIPKVREAVDRAAETGKPFGLFALGATEAKQHLASVKVAGLAPNSEDDWRHVQRYVALHERVVSFLTRWNAIADSLSVPRLDGGIGALRTLERIGVAARSAHKLAVRFDAALPRLAEAVFQAAPAKAFVGGSAELCVVREQLLRHLTRADLAKAATQLSALQEKLAGKTGPISEALRRFIENDLGNPSLDGSRAAASYAELLAETRRIAALAQDFATVRDCAGRFERAGAPRLAARIRSVPVKATGEDTTLPVTWLQAWTWARVKSHLDSIEAREELLALSERRRNLENGLSRFYKEMVAKAAWLATKRNATPKVLQALAGYATAIRKIGQGTGPNAVRYRRDAREAMLDAADAVPCWIMSHAKISEAMPATIGAFDLVVVDEASQSDLWALPAIVRGKKILVVGDDKQVSPDGGFLSSERITELKHRFLEEQPYGVEMTPEKSLYELAARVFAGSQVMLREHFRCVPPIIAYSNRTFYKGQVQPLRIPKATERIDPPLVDVYVKEGLRDRRDCNQFEALAIAEEIAAILKDPRMADRTIGVVSLLGMEQAKHIDSLVRRRCPAGELLHRKFECGDARTFQGSERDIIFLSLVVDPTNCRAVSGIMFDQRFNVAASRARDRMYLVRSVDASHLSDKDLRLSLLSHFDKPLVADPSEQEHLIDLCESGFEREVFGALTKHGYRVIPQVRTGAYRIDMVVEGLGDVRLAIECDGDDYHGPDRWAHDMHRQRVLERAGWTFWRCFASTWSLRKDEVFAELIERLTSMGIEPLGAVEHAPSLVEKRFWTTPTEAPKHDAEPDLLELL
ncbi:MAG: very short patch repair endonuclease [Rhodocyclaceae bacterium]|nr:very short patch repair endonuclease [Rhodocyclaceae bacterium]